MKRATKEKTGNEKVKEKKKRLANSDHTGTDTDADHTDIGDESDITSPEKERRRFQKKRKYDKPKREVDPDRTGIDTEADKTEP